MFLTPPVESMRGDRNEPAKATPVLFQDNQSIPVAQATIAKGKSYSDLPHALVLL